MTHGTHFPLATSRYQAGDRIIASELAPIRITRGAPRFKLPYLLSGNIRQLAPDPVEFKIRDRAQFTQRYHDRMDTLGVEAVRDLLTVTSDDNHGRGLVLLCFEDVDGGADWCHRLVFAEWWQDRTGQAVPELGTPA